MTELTYKYEPATQEKGRHIWSVSGPGGGIHVWASHLDGDAAFWGSNWIGGVEVHSRVPMYEGQAPHDECWLIGGKCFHDGSSLYFSENIAPMLRDQITDAITEYIHSVCLSWYRGRFGKGE